MDDSGKSEGGEEVAAVSLKSFSGKFEQRPIAEGLFLKTEVRNVIVTGKANKEGKLAVIAQPDAPAEGEEDVGWLRLLYESNPVDSEAGVRLHLFVNPVQIKYDADTVNGIVQFFKPPESVALRQLQAQAVMALESLRESTVAKVGSYSPSDSISLTFESTLSSCKISLQIVKNFQTDINFEALMSTVFVHIIYT